MFIAVDFDGTCVDHRYPAVGNDVPGAVRCLKKFVAQGHKIILWTMRSDESPDGRMLAEAILWFSRKGIPLFGKNCNPTQATWTNSPKAYAHIYIDDAAIGCPLRENPRLGGRPYVDWDKVEEAVMERMGK